MRTDVDNALELWLHFIQLFAECIIMHWPLQIAHHHLKGSTTQYKLSNQENKGLERSVGFYSK